MMLTELQPKPDSSPSEHGYCKFHLILRLGLTYFYEIMTHGFLNLSKLLLFYKYRGFQHLATSKYCIYPIYRI